jgi:hypothetical protein
MNTQTISKFFWVMTLLFSFACETQDIIEPGPLGFGIEHTKNPLSNEVSFSVYERLNLDGELSVSDKKLHFSFGDGTEIELTDPIVVEADGTMTMTYETIHTYAGSGGYTVSAWFDEIPLQKFSKEILLDPLVQ